MTNKQQKNKASKANNSVATTDYTDFVERLKGHINSARNYAVRTVNTALIELYSTIGAEILVKQKEAGWGDGCYRPDRC